MPLSISIWLEKKFDQISEGSEMCAKCPHWCQIGLEQPWYFCLNIFVTFIKDISLTNSDDTFLKYISRYCSLLSLWIFSLAKMWRFLHLNEDRPLLNIFNWWKLYFKFNSHPDFSSKYIALLISWIFKRLPFRSLQIELTKLSL